VSAVALTVVADESAVASYASDLVEAALRERRATVLALPTGRTPIPLYAELGRRCASGLLSLAEAYGFNLDEWVGVPATAEGSYAKFMDDYFYRHVDLPTSRRFIPNGMAPDLEAECLRYEELLRGVGGIDLAILGIGGNGHIGFNEPGTSFESRTHVCRVAAETREANAYSFPSGSCPFDAMTVGIKTILEARQIVLLVTGAGKARILAAALTGPIDESVPASVLQRHPRVRVVADRAAAECLPSIP
jgi:glucosamine-6-phosphate deaminase